MLTRVTNRVFFSATVLIVLCCAMPLWADLVLHFDMEQAESPLIDLASGYTAEQTDDGHLYGVPGPEGFGNAVGLEDNGSWRLDVDESKIFREFANDFSVATWIYLDSDTLDFKAELAEPNSALNRFFGDDIAWDADGWGMGVWEDGRVRFTKNGVVDLDTADSWVELDEWVHLAATISSEDGVTIYVDGEEAELFADTRDLNNGTGNNGEDDLYGVGRTYDIGEGQWVGGRFDEIRVYDHVLTEDEVVALLSPGEGLLGDFDGDNLLTVNDINLLTAESIAMTNDPKFDLNGDDVVDDADRTVWVKDLKKTYFGDANLDGEFNTTDLVDIFQAGKFELDQDADWSQGDWTGENRFNTSDLVKAFQDGGFEKGPVATAAVPEPASGLLLILGFFGIVVRVRQRR